jgi:hypothetical protein
MYDPRPFVPSSLPFGFRIRIANWKSRKGEEKSTTAALSFDIVSGAIISSAV